MEYVNPQAAQTVLVVDDDAEIYPLIRALLAGTEWNADFVGGGEEALARLEIRAYDVILTDILMPGMDGLTLLGRIRDRHPNACIVVMTVDNTPHHVLGSLRGEAASYLSKPFSRSTLLSTLISATSRSLNAGDIKVLSDRPQWISLQVACRLTTADRLTQFMRELPGNLSSNERDQIAMAFRELLINAVEHGGHFDPDQTVDLSYIRTARSLVYYIRDPGEGFSFDALAHAAIGNTSEEPFGHLEVRKKMNLRSGGFGLLMAKSFADELLYSAKGNEVIFIKYL
jgi:CheY-like chemotaxis protein